MSQLPELLWKQWQEFWTTVAEQTVRALGEEQAARFIDLANGWIEIQGAVFDAYAQEEWLSSLVFLTFQALLKEVWWFNFQFLAGSYPPLHRSLRFGWEMIYRAYYADTHVSGTADDKVAWLKRQERKPAWPNVIEPTLRQLLPPEERGKIEQYCMPTWRRLNECVHPSMAVLENAVGDSALLVRDAFDREWALGTLKTAGVVFDLVWLAVLSRFPKCIEAVVRAGVLADCPLASGVLEKGGSGHATDRSFTDRRQGWCRDLEVLEEAIDDLLENRNCFRGIRDLVAGNPALGREDIIVPWMFQNYASGMVLEVRKQVDKDPRSVSLINLLTSIEECPEALSRESYLEACGWPEEPIRTVHEQHFTERAGPGPWIDPAIVRKDKEELVNFVKPVREMANKAVAHRDRTGPPELPTYGELHQCIDQIVALFKKYNLLLRAKDYSPRELELPADWNEVFCQPWIPQEQSGSG
jgi:hypothetical protein